MQEFIRKNFLRREIDDSAEGLVEALVQFQNVVAVFLVDEFQDTGIGDGGAKPEGCFGDEEAVHEVFFVVQRVRRKRLVFKIRDGFKKIQRCLDKACNVNHC